MFGTKKRLGIRNCSYVLSKYFPYHGESASTSIRRNVKKDNCTPSYQIPRFLFLTCTALKKIKGTWEHKKLFKLYLHPQNPKYISIIFDKTIAYRVLKMEFTDHNKTFQEMLDLICNQTLIDISSIIHLCEKNEIFEMNITRGNIDAKLFYSSWTVFVLGTILNVTLFVIIWKLFISQTFIYQLNLLVTDMLVMLSIPLTIYFPIIVAKGNPVHDYLLPSLDILLTSSTVLFALVTISENVLNSLHKFHFTSNALKKKKKKISIALWLYCLLVFLLFYISIVKKTFQIFNKIVVWMAVIVTGLTCIFILIFYFSTIFYYCRYDFNQETLLTNTGANKYILKIRVFNRFKKSKDIIFNGLAVLTFCCGYMFCIGIHIYEMGTNTFIRNKNVNIAMLYIPWIIPAIMPMILVLSHKRLRCYIIKRLKKRQNHDIEQTEMVTLDICNE